MASTALRCRIAPLAIGLCLSACSPANSGRDQWSDRAVAALGAQDGYLFVFSPFNCSLRSEQIAAINALADRQRRGGRFLTIGHELADSLVAADAVAQLGIRLQARPFATSGLTKGEGRAGLAAPLAIAIRHGEVIAVLSGASAERLDSWLAWLEQWPRSTHP